MHPPNPKAQKGWYSRGYIPHFDYQDALQFITFRLADSLPQQKLHQLKQAQLLSLSTMCERQMIERWLDTGYGCCALGHPALAEVMQQTLCKFDRLRYRLIAWCIMPNHVHVLIDPKEALGKIVQSWKSYTGRWALKRNAELGLGVPGEKLWMRDYWDRYIRDETHYMQAVDYIEKNPVKAGLCKSPEDWPWSSARFRKHGALPGTPSPSSAAEPEKNT